MPSINWNINSIKMWDLTKMANKKKVNNHIW